MKAQHQQQEQHHRQRHPQRQGLCGALGRAMVADHVKQRRAKAGEDDDDEQYDNDAHDVVRSSVTQPDIRWL